MNNLEILIKVKEGLNKLDSLDYDNMECWQIFSAFNKVQKGWVRKQLHGYNARKQGDEASKFSIDDLQVLLVEVPLNASEQLKYYETDLLPDNYVYWKRVLADTKMECCPPRALRIHLTEMANVEDMLDDDSKRPSAEWGETFATLIGNRIRIYTNDEFDIQNVKLIYYRLPVDVTHIDLNTGIGCIDLTTGMPATAEVQCEFKNDIAEILVDETIALLAGNIESINEYQINKTSVVEKT